MSPAALEQYLHEHIPLSKAMEVSVEAVGQDAVVLRAPLAPNINLHETVFAGSASAVAILAAWSLVYTRLRDEGAACRIVIGRNAVQYARPIGGDFTARSYLDEPGEWQRFTHSLTRKGKARIGVSAVLEYAGQVTGRFDGEFVALGI